MRLVVMSLSILTVLAGCSSSNDTDQAASYCAVVESTAAAYDVGPFSAEQVSETGHGSIVMAKRAAMAERKDAAPAEIRGYWDTVTAAPGDVDPADAVLARARIDAFEAEHC
jgi:hypothetical protein